MVFSTIVSGISAAAQIFMGAQAQKRAKKQLDEMEEIDFQKTIAESMGPALEEELQRIQEIKQQSATASEALLASGSSADLGAGLGNIQQSTFQAVGQERGRIQQERLDVDKLRLQNEQFIKGLESQRFENRAAGLAAEYTSGAQSVLSGIQGIAQTVGGFEAAKLEQERFDLGQNQDRSKFLAFINDMIQKGIDPAEIPGMYDDVFGSK